MIGTFFFTRDNFQFVHQLGEQYNIMFDDIINTKLKCLKFGSIDRINIKKTKY